jgi:hypothetical protein
MLAAARPIRCLYRLRWLCDFGGHLTRITIAGQADEWKDTETLLVRVACLQEGKQLARER